MEDQSSAREGALKSTRHFLKNMNQRDLANQLEKNELDVISQNKLKSYLKEKSKCMFKGIAKQGNVTLNEIELYIPEGGNGEVSNEHEVRQIEMTSKRPETQDTPIKYNNMFKPLPGRDKPIRTILTKGIAGIGKTFSVQKFILDWAEGKANQDIQFLYPLPFRELNLMKGEKYNLVDILHNFFKETEFSISSFDKHKVVFIFDGLDECLLPLDFQNNESLSDVTKQTSLDALMTNLIKGNLLPASLLWITSRPAAANNIPPECVDLVTEIRGFNDPQKEEYFSKIISDQILASKISEHMKSSRSLHIMCHIPVFCWISATVLERMLGDAESGEIPKTLTQMYTHFLIFQTKWNQKYDGKHEADPHREKVSILSLGKLAFQQLEKGNLIFYEEDLRECGIDVREASVYSGVYTQIFREESGLYQGKVYCFVHLSFQEFLAALYVFLSFNDSEGNILGQQQATPVEADKTVLGLHMRAVDEALQSENGHLDLFLRFLLGLSLESNQLLISGLTKTPSISQNTEKTVAYIKEKIRENPSPEKSINLFHCLNELNDHSLVEEVESYLSSGSLSSVTLSPAQWSALVFVLMTSEEELDVFDLKDYICSEEALLRLLPVAKASRGAKLNNCDLKERSCAALASALSSNSSCLKELDMSENELQDSGVKQLCAGLKNQHCELQTLSMLRCSITEEGCAALASALTSNPSHLRELRMSWNNLGNSGVKQLSDVLKDPRCKLETLWLSDCSITEEGCTSLASALTSNPSHLRDLALNSNKVGDSGVKQLSAVLTDPHCNLETLVLSDCSITEDGCTALASALSSNPSHLRYLDLNYNKIGDSGVKQLSGVLKDPRCKLETLWVSECCMEEGCAFLASALRSNPSHLRELDLGSNKLGDSGVKQLADVLKDPRCKLEKLWLSPCSVTEEGCASLASALSSKSSNLRKLSVGLHNIKGVGVKLLSAVKEDPHSKLKTLY